METIAFHEQAIPFHRYNFEEFMQVIIEAMNYGLGSNTIRSYEVVMQPELCPFGPLLCRSTQNSVSTYQAKTLMTVQRPYFERHFF